jgi:phenylpyruvate tautomerase PptA (4-oxalocrotonate tautomerase family)
MPILDVAVVGPLPDGIRSGLAQRVADAAALVFGSGPQETWVTIRYVPLEDYAENAGGPPVEVQPVIVSVLQAHRPGPRPLADQAARLAQAVADACGRLPENVHLIYQPDGRGRVAFGGRIVD